MGYDFGTWDRNCEHEQTEPLQASVTGTVPTWLKGSLVTNGPGRMKYGKEEFQHVFDGSAILQKFSFGENGVAYTSRFIRSYAFLSNSEHQKIVVSEFGTKGTSVAKGAFNKMAEKFQFDKLFSDNPPVTLGEYGGQWWATTEAPFLHRIDLDTLETCEKVDLHKVQGANSQCPHPVTLSDGSTLNVFNIVGAMGPKYELAKYPALPPKGKPNVFADKPQRICAIDTRWKLNPCHMHQFCVTAGHALLPEQPMTVDVTAMVANTIREKPLIDGMEWINGKDVKFRVISLGDGKELKHKYKAPSFFYMHIVNSFEEDGHIVADFITFANINMLYAFKIQNIRVKGDAVAKDLDVGNVKRLVFPLTVDEKAPPTQNLVKLPGSKAAAFLQKDGSVMLQPEELCSTAYEVPTIHPGYQRKKYQFFYGACSDMKDHVGSVGKVNVLTGEVKRWGTGDLYASALSFVPKPGSEAEDCGVLLCHCLSSSRSHVTLSVLDAKDMKELATATWALPSDAPRSLHAIYRP